MTCSASHQDDGGRLLSDAGLAAGVAVGAGVDRRDARRDPHPGAGRHRSRVRWRIFPLRRQSSRDQRDDRIFRAADGGHAHRHHLRRTGRLSLAARHGIPHPAAGGGGRRGRRRHARPAARLRARPAAGVEAVQVHADRPAHAGEERDRQALRQRARPRDGDRGRARRTQVRHLDADVVQIDEANLPGNPDEWRWAAAAINRVLDAVKTTPAVHLCFGNYGGQTIQKGEWES